MRPIDRLFLLMPGYTDEMICEFVNRVFDCCGSEDAKDDMPTSIQTYLKAKSYKEAIQNLGSFFAISFRVQSGRASTVSVPRTKPSPVFSAGVKAKPSFSA